MQKLWKKTIVTWDDFAMSDDVCAAVATSIGLKVCFTRLRP
jgi:hypothetical protein